MANNRKKTCGSTPASEPKAYYCMVTAMVVFETTLGMQMITRSTFGSSNTPNFPAAYIFQLQNTLALQVQQEIDGGTDPKLKFVKAHDVVVQALIPLGHMTNSQFWENMLENKAADPAAPPLPPEVPTAEQVAAATLSAGVADSNVVPFQPSN